MKALIVETKGNGHIANFTASINDLDNWTRIIALAWAVVDTDTGEVLKDKHYLIKPNGWTIPDALEFIAKGKKEASALMLSKFWSDNNFTTATNEAEGKLLEEVLADFILDHDECEVLAAHNMSVEHPMLCAEMIRYNLKPNKKLPKISMMQALTEFCRLPHKKFKKQFRYPKISEIYKALTGYDFKGVHDAKNDLAHVRKSFIEAFKRKLIKP